MMTTTTAHTPTSLRRRTFLKWSGLAAGTVGLVGTAPTFASSEQLSAADGRDDVDATVWNACLVNCHSRCPLRLQVKDGTVVRVLPDNTGSDELGDFQIRACVRGRTQRDRIYSADRIKKPLKRKEGTPRGGGEWEEISWDDALDLVADEIKRVKSEYGNESIYYPFGTGSAGGNITGWGSWPRLLNMYGGYLNWYGNYSWAQLMLASTHHYGAPIHSNTLEDAQHANLQVMFGNNPLETRMSGGGELAVSQKVRKDFGVRTIIIDPRYTESSIGLADQWIPIRPGTDAALVAAIIHVLLENDLHDQDFLDKYCVGFDEDTLPEDAPSGSSYRSYIEGNGPDGVAKTPEWASNITGIPAQTIRTLAVEIGTAKPCAITQGWGVQRQANGETTARAIFTLAAVIGQIGVSGGGNGAREGAYNIQVQPFPRTNDGNPPPLDVTIPVFNWTRAIEDGENFTATNNGLRGKEKLGAGIKMMIAHACNTILNQHHDINHTKQVLSDESKCEFIVAIDHQMTPTCEMADLVLPGTTNFEEEDVIPGYNSGDMGSVFIAEKAIDPLFESKTSYDICTEVAKRLGVEQEFTQGRTQAEWRTWIIEQTQEQIPGFPSEEELVRDGIWRTKNPAGHYVAMKDFREDPEANPLGTPSGKIEIYSQSLADLNTNWEFDDSVLGDRIPAVPEYVKTWEGAEEALTNTEYPLQCIGHHYKGRVHASYGNLPVLQEAHRHGLWISTSDAKERGIEHGDEVLIYNSRGTAKVEAFVTPRMMPGTVSLPQGSWYKPNNEGVDEGACVNTLTRDFPTPLAKANPAHTMLVEVKKA